MMPALSVFSALWGNQWSRLIVVAIVAAGFGWVQGFRAVPRVDVAAIERNTVAGRDAYWQSKINEQERIHDRELAEAIEAADTTPAVTSDAELDRLCAESVTCRDKGNDG